MKNYYEILQVSPESTLNDIKKSFNSLVLLYHPDKQQQQQHSSIELVESIKNRYLDLQSAYECLRDINKRSIYDSQLLELSRQKYSITDEIDLDDMEYNEDTLEYYYNCRCGDKFVIREDQLSNDIDVACCGGCSLAIKVLFSTLDQE
ncbi:DNAJ heat shock N-terminal domain-containing protein [Tieghemostelium lacteum]|uniref:DNAJ heat shock N-terminal domain-containing protein n=1 Tax=Tieghemostelium lacteum TaxID=361077 RepID=A0A152A5K0_TIELA|nr:DNAJ heat shock N-terminal domain-containing protein [Tieghemostelium lacteum]|eukprot:KYR01498.1 DNAJ heat shock N-terminal domain-containing protein [Tieghemostelium lacteum]